jgi:hypothetical protein
MVTAMRCSILRIPSILGKTFRAYARHRTVLIFVCYFYTSETCRNLKDFLHVRKSQELSNGCKQQFIGEDHRSALNLHLAKQSGPDAAVVKAIC